MNELIELYNIHSPSAHEEKMNAWLVEHLCDLGFAVYIDEAENVYAQYGDADSFPCIVAHTDEVHKDRPDDFEVVQFKNFLFGFSESERDFCGIGADDKNGVWIAMKVAQAFSRANRPMKCAFFASEEIGCLGSGDAEMDFFKDVRFVLQCDRKGAGDFITQAGGVELCSKEFEKAVARTLKVHGYKTTTGLTTDVMQLKLNGLKVSCANISCGYYNPHTDREMTNISELRNALALVKTLMLMKDQYPHEVKDRWSHYNWYRWGYGGYRPKSTSLYDREWGAPIRFAPPATPTPGRADDKKDNGDDTLTLWSDTGWDY